MFTADDPAGKALHLLELGAELQQQQVGARLLECRDLFAHLLCCADEAWHAEMAFGIPKRRYLYLTTDVLYYALMVNAKSPILRLIQQMGMVRTTDLEARGIPRAELYRLVRKGTITRQARGLYTISRHTYTTNHVLAQVAKRVPMSVFCLLTALRFHNLTTQSPADVWIALSPKARKPELDYPRLRVARFSGASLAEGVETHRIEGVAVRMYSAAKTVADCFKYRNKIGIDVAVEALRDFSSRYRGGANDLARFARICRVTRVMQPYLDSIL